MANQNHALGKTLERMGMSMAEFVQHMKEKDKKPMEDAVVTGSGQPPPPPPPPPPTLVREKSRSRSARPQEFTIATPRAQPPSREASMASTVRYPSRGPEPEPPRAQIARTIAREELGRSRSRGGPPEPILPIAEDEGPRGRQMTKPEGPMAEKAKTLLRKQQQGINMGESKIHLGRFAKNFAQVKQKARNAEQAASVPPPPKQKTYDDIEKEVEEVVPDPGDARLRKKQQFPAGAFLKRERLDSEGRKSLRYQGMPIKV
jgi:hypothetical protein